MQKLIATVLIMFLFSVPIPVHAGPLDELYNIVETQYIEPVDGQALRSVPPGELARFLQDPYAAYFSAEEFLDFLESFTASYGGVGIQIFQEGREIRILQVYPHSPAAKAGLLPGDLLTRVDGAAVADLLLAEVAALIRGKVDTSVTLELRRGAKVFKRILIRQEIERPAVISLLKGDIGYLRILAFTETTPALFQQQLAALRRANPRGYILDLRDNPGGVLNAALAMAQEFLPAGPVMMVRNRAGIENIYGNSTSGQLLPNLVVLVNGNSASAAEILAGAVQDHAVGLLLGENTFGKASMQTVFMLASGSAFKLTTGRYLTAGGQAIDGVGLSPDIMVSGYQAQLEAAKELIRATSSTMVFRMAANTAWFTGGAVNMAVPPFIYGGRSYVPVRLLAEKMGTTVVWERASRIVTLRKGSTTLQISLNGAAVEPGGNPFAMEPALIRNGRVFLPVRALTAALGGQVWWDAHSKEVIVAW